MPRRFELKQAKDEVGGELASILPAAVRRFLATPRFDALVSACILYFVALFQREYLRLAVDKAAKAAGGALAFDAVAVASKLAALQADADAARASLSPLYAQVRPIGAERTVHPGRHAFRWRRICEPSLR